MTTNLREIVQSLLDCNLAQMAYYDHSDEGGYYNSQVITEYDMPDYDNNLHKDIEPCIIFAGSGDYVGSTIDMANRRYIEQNYKELIDQGHIIYQSQGYGYTAMIIFFLRLPVVRSGLFDDMEYLTDYPLFDDEIESAIQQELLEESWDNWLADDFGSEIEKRTGIEFINTDWQAELFWEILRNGDGGEYYPETGENIYVDMNEVFKGSEQIIEIIKDNSDKLESEDYRIEENWNSEKGRLVWALIEINAVLKDIVRSGLESVVMIPYPVKPDCQYDFQKHNFCHNCHQVAVCKVNDIDLCPDCYNLLMDYHPKCQKCQEKNVSASLQYSLLENVNNLTHCQDCKQAIIEKITN